MPQPALAMVSRGPVASLILVDNIDMVNCVKFWYPCLLTSRKKLFLNILNRLLIAQVFLLQEDPLPARCPRRNHLLWQGIRGAALFCFFNVFKGNQIISLQKYQQRLDKTYYAASYVEGQCDDHDKRSGPMESFPMMLDDATYFGSPNNKSSQI